MSDWLTGFAKWRGQGPPAPGPDPDPRPPEQAWLEDFRVWRQKQQEQQQVEPQPTDLRPMWLRNMFGIKEAAKTATTSFLTREQRGLPPEPTPESMAEAPYMEKLVQIDPRFGGLPTSHEHFGEALGGLTSPLGIAGTAADVAAVGAGTISRKGLTRLLKLLGKVDEAAPVARRGVNLLTSATDEGVRAGQVVSRGGGTVPTAAEAARFAEEIKAVRRLPKVEPKVAGFTMKTRKGSPIFALHGWHNSKVVGQILDDRINVITISKGEMPNSKSLVTAIRELGEREGKDIYFPSKGSEVSEDAMRWRERMMDRGELVNTDQGLKLTTPTKPPAPPTGQAPAAKALSKEELARNEYFYKVDRSGNLTFQGKQPDPAAPLKPGEGVFGIGPKGELRLAQGDPASATKIAGKQAELRRPKLTEEPTELTLDVEPSDKPLQQQMEELLDKPTAPTKAGLDIEGGMAAAVEGAEDAPKIGNINMSNLPGMSRDARRVLVNTAEKMKGQLKRRYGVGKRTTVQEMEGAVDMSPKALKRLLGDTGLSESEVLTLRHAARNAAEMVADLARKSRASPGDAVLFEKFRKAYDIQTEFQSILQGVTARWGKAGTSLKVKIAESMPGMQKAIAELGRKRTLKEIRDAVADLTPEQAAIFAKKMPEPTWFDRLLEYRYGAMLYNPITQLRNALGNLSAAITPLVEKPGAAGFDFAMSFGGLRRPRERFFGEVAQHYAAMWKGRGDAWRSLVRTYRTGESPFGGVAEKFGYSTLKKYPKAIGGKKGEVARYPLKVLGAVDEGFKQTNYMAALQSEAYRAAAKKGLKGDALLTEMNRIIADMPEDIMNKAFSYAEKMTFTNKGQLVKMVNKVRAGKTTQLLYPFARVSTNLAAFGAERTPLAYPITLVRALLPKGHKYALRGGELADALARPAIMTAALIGLREAVRDGHITGDRPIGADKRGGRYAEAGGWKRNSLLIKMPWEDAPKYRSYENFEPLSSILSLTANMLSSDAPSELMQRTFDGVISAFVEPTILGETREHIEALFGGGEAAAKHAEKFIASFLPFGGATGQAARWMDPKARRYEKPGDYIKMRIPGVRETTPERKDVYDRPMPSTKVINKKELDSLMRSEKLATARRKTSKAADQYLEGKGTQEELQTILKAAREMVKAPTTRREKETTAKLRADRKQYGAATEETTKTFSLKDLVYKTEWRLAYLQGNRKRMREIQREAYKNGFRIKWDVQKANADKTIEDTGTLDTAPERERRGGIYGQ